MSAPKAAVLFDLPISTGGNIVCTQPAPKIYLITFTSPPDNRLTTAFCQTLILALDIITTKHEPGVVITTSGIGKFYSNGLNLDHASFTPGFWSESLYALWRKLLIYPMPTIALINGHAFAGALMLSMMHDYRIMNPAKGFLCLNELELGAPLRPPMTSIFREKCNPATFRKLILLAHRFNAKEALQEGLVDRLGGLDEALGLVGELGLLKKGAPGLSGKSTYWVLKREMWRETVEYLEKAGEEAGRDFRIEMRKKKDDEEARKRVERWQIQRSKL